MNPARLLDASRFDLAMELPDESNIEFGGLGANLWPSDLPGFQDTVYGWYLAAGVAARQLFVAFAEMYELPAGTFLQYESERSSSMMRLLRYPPNEGQNRRQHRWHQCPHRLRGLHPHVADSSWSGVASPVAASGSNHRSSRTDLS